MSRWKPPGSKKKAADTSGGTGRVISCSVLILGAMGLLYLLFSAMLNK